MNTSKEGQKVEEGPSQVSLWDFMAILFAGLTAFLVGVSDYPDWGVLIFSITVATVFFILSLVLGLIVKSEYREGREWGFPGFASVILVGIALLVFYALLEVSVSMVIAIILTCVSISFGIKSGKTPLKLCFILFSVSVILSFSIWISKLHNFENLERDKRLVTELVTSREGDSTVLVTLPPEFANEHQYLSQVLSIEFEMNWPSSSIPWSEAIRCTEGDSVWYKLLLPTKNGAANLFFDHPWKDYRTSVTLPNLPLVPSIGDGLSSSTIRYW